MTSATRTPSLPDLPPIGEFLPGYEATSFEGIAAPKNTPVEIVDKLNKAINAGFTDQKFKARLADLGGEGMPGTPADFTKVIADETEKWGKVVKFAGLKAEMIGCINFTEEEHHGISAPPLFAIDRCCRVCAFGARGARGYLSVPRRQAHRRFSARRRRRFGGPHRRQSACRMFGASRSSSRTGPVPARRLALDAVAHAPPDGYTMLLAPGSPQVQAFLFSTLTFNPATDFAPVSLIGTYPDIIAVGNNSNFKTLQDFIAYAKANPGKVSWASPGVGTVPHLAGELFKHMTHLEMTHVPYRGMTDGLMTDLMTGRLDLMFNTTGSLLQPVRSKQLRGLAVTTAQRFPDEPELPTVAEQGVPGYDVSSWYGLYVPAKTPPDIIKKINADMVAMLSQPAIKEKFAPLGVLAQGSTPQELAAKNAGDAALWEPIIKEANIKVE